MLGLRLSLGEYQGLWAEGKIGKELVVEDTGRSLEWLGFHGRTYLRYPRIDTYDHDRFRGRSTIYSIITESSVTGLVASDQSYKKPPTLHDQQYRPFSKPRSPNELL